MKYVITPGGQINEAFQWLQDDEQKAMTVANDLCARYHCKVYVSRLVTQFNQIVERIDEPR